MNSNFVGFATSDRKDSGPHNSSGVGYSTLNGLDSFYQLEDKGAHSSTMSSVSPALSEGRRCSPAISQTPVQKMPMTHLGSVDQVLAGASSSVRSNQPRPSENFESTGLFSQFASQLQSFSVQPNIQTQAVAQTDQPAQMALPMPSFPPQQAQMPMMGMMQTDNSAQMAQTFASALLQQMLCNSFSAATAAPQLNNTNIMTQLMAQLLTAQLAQSTQAAAPSAPMAAGVAQLLQAFGSSFGSAQPAMPSPAAASLSSVMAQIPFLDAASSRNVILKLVKQLVQSGDLADDDVTRRFVERIQFTGNDASQQSMGWSGQMQHRKLSSPLVNQGTGPSPQLPVVTIKAEVDVSDTGYGGVSKKAMQKPDHSVGQNFDSDPSLPRDDTQDSQAGVEGGNVTWRKPLNDKKSASGDGGKKSPKQYAKKQVAKRTGKPVKSAANASRTGESEKRFKKTEDTDFGARSDLDEQQSISGKRLRNRSKSVKYNEDWSDDGVDDSGSEYEKPKKKKFQGQTSSVKKSSVTKNDATKLSKPVTDADEISQRVKQTQLNLIAPGRKKEVSEEISVLPNVSTCRSPEVRYLFMGRKSDGMDWLNLVSYTSKDGSTANQCLFCPMTSSDVKTVADHIIAEHSDLGFVLKNIKQPNGRVTFLACRHCNYVTFEATLIWIHFEMYHGIAGIMDGGSGLPPVMNTKSVNIKGICLDNAVNSCESRVAYVCLDCMLCGTEGYQVAQHVLDVHPDTSHFNGCFVKLIMIRSRTEDTFTFRQAMCEEKYSHTLRDAYFCMLCEYTSNTAYLAMSHSLRVHQQKRLLFICSECNQQYLQESNLITHMSTSHRYTGLTSFMCSTTLVYSCSDGTFVENEIPAMRKKLDVATSDRTADKQPKQKSAGLIQSTAVSSSQVYRSSAKDKCSTNQHEDDSKSCTDAMPTLKVEIKTEVIEPNDFTDAPMLRPCSPRHQ